MTAAALASETRLPRATVAKILKTLAHAGIVAGARGAAGGYRLARAASAISVAEVVAAIDGSMGVDAMHDPRADLRRAAPSARPGRIGSASTWRSAPRSAPSPWPRWPIRSARRCRVRPRRNRQQHRNQHHDRTRRQPRDRPRRHGEGYKYGFVTDIESDSAPPGLNEDTVRFISAKKERAGMAARMAARSLPPLADDGEPGLGEAAASRRSIIRPRAITPRRSRGGRNRSTRSIPSC